MGVGREGFPPQMLSYCCDQRLLGAQGGDAGHEMRTVTLCERSMCVLLRFVIEGGEASLGVLTVLSENPGIQEGSGHFFKQCQHGMPAAREQILPAEEEHTASTGSTAVPPVGLLRILHTARNWRQSPRRLPGTRVFYPG